MSNEKVIDIDNATVEEQEVKETTEKTTFEKVTDKATDIGGKAMDKAREGINYIYNNPGKTLAFIGSLWAGYKTVVRPVLRDINDIKHECTYYDRYGSQHSYECKRKLTNNELYELDEYVKSGGNAYEWLKGHRLARR